VYGSFVRNDVYHKGDSYFEAVELLHE
jgi:hypothetical protein